MKISDENLKKIVKDVAGEDPFWNIPVYDVVRKIIDLPKGTDFGIGDLINPDYNISTMSPKMQKDIYDSVIDVCKKIGINLLETSPEIRMNEHSFTWALTKTNDDTQLSNDNVDNNNTMEKSDSTINTSDSDEANNYSFHKDKIFNKTWWVDNRGVKGERLFSFDKKKIYNLFRDYPHELTKEEKEIFDKENPYWADFFKDRK